MQHFGWAYKTGRADFILPEWLRNQDGNGTIQLLQEERLFSV